MSWFSNLLCWSDKHQFQLLIRINNIILFFYVIIFQKPARFLKPSRFLESL